MATDGSTGTILYDPPAALNSNTSMFAAQASGGNDATLTTNDVMTAIHDGTNSGFDFTFAGLGHEAVGHSHAETGGDTFKFRNLGTAVPTGSFESVGDNSDLEHAATANFAEFQLLMSVNRIGHDPLLTLGHGDLSGVAHILAGQLHTEGFMFS